MMSDSDDGACYSEDDASQASSGAEFGEGDFAVDQEGGSRQASYTVYTEPELKERQRRSMDQITSVLSVSQGEAVRLLCEYKWDVNRVNEEWFADMDAVRGKVGLAEQGDDLPSRPAKKKLKCGICFDSFPPGSTASCGGACCHHFCKDCWRQYVHTAIDSGPSVLSLRCPEPSCKAAVPEEVFREVASPDQHAKLQQFVMRSFVEDNRTMTWCPAPGCEFAVESKGDLGGMPLDVACKCGSAFCFQCKEEAHRPVACETVKTWLIKNSAESENLNWIMAHTKQCPKCKRPIEKNQGCMHMTCSQCRHEFCWLCQGSWAEHGERTGGFYACNRFETAERAGEYDEESRRREQAKNALERYMHYYQRWAENDKAKDKARAQAQDSSERQLHRLSELTATPTSQLKFICDAWDQVVDCRRILKWTYTYGYYTFGEHADKGSASKLSVVQLKQMQEFFEFNQGQAEAYLEKLHSMAEKDLKDLQRLMEDPSAATAGAEASRIVSGPDWPHFRQTLIGLTDVTRSHFNKLVEELEKGMSEMMSAYTVEEAMEVAQEAPAKPAKASKHATGKRARANRGAERATTTRSHGTSPEGAMGDSDLEVEAGHWQCVNCTFANQLTANRCAMCDSERARR